MSTYLNYIVEAKDSDGTWKQVSRRTQWTQGRLRDMFSANSFEERKFEERGFPQDCTVENGQHYYGQSWVSLSEILQMVSFHYERMKHELKEFCTSNEYEICRGLIKDKSFDELERKHINVILEDEFSAFNDYLNLFSFAKVIQSQVAQSELMSEKNNYFIKDENIRLIYWFD